MCVKYDLEQVLPLSLSSVKGVICTLTRYGWLVSVGNVQSHPRVTQVWESFSRFRRSYVHTPSGLPLKTQLNARIYMCLHVLTLAYMCLHVPACAYMCLLVFYWHVPSYRCLWLLFGSELSCFI